MEVLYSTGMRRSEVVSLLLHDIARGDGASTVFIRQSKGCKDRIVPIGARALRWLDRYLAEVRTSFVVEVRTSFVVDETEQALFLSESGARVHADTLSFRVSGYAAEADLGRRGSRHLFRHTVATLMLEAGADVRLIQEMLGHSNLKTTEIYTRVSIRHLSEVHAATHPAERGPALASPTPATTLAESASSDEAGSSPL